ncbi:HAD family hydrolase [Spirochaeta cellobiosiphila]|uniref:HAD family hydrolase n=1 Tax=Spirochaeta cellobiosiphila TaxID=504483 RepID=UPI000421DA70|nr:HAD family phosphatase [Spirochaeta cellobiosiphila]
MKYKGIIYDLDGTIVDSEPIFYESDKQFVENYGGSYTEEENKKFIGAGGRAFVQYFIEKLNLKKSLEDLLYEKDQIYLALAKEKGVNPFPAVVQLIEWAAQKRIKQTVASGSSLKIISEILKITKLDTFFPIITSSDEVGKGKPHPDVFLMAAERMSLDPKSCLVLEDSIHGVEAAIRAGMDVIAFNDNKEALKQWDESSIIYQSPNASVVEINKVKALLTSD